MGEIVRKLEHPNRDFEWDFEWESFDKESRHWNNRNTENTLFELQEEILQASIVVTIEIVKIYA